MNPEEGRGGKRVLEEDTYLESVSTLLKRDYFPLLSEYNDNIEDINLPDSLNRFLANNTTEDDASFERIQEAEDRRRRAILSKYFNDEERLFVGDAPRGSDRERGMLEEGKFKRPLLLKGGTGRVSSSDKIKVENTRFPSTKGLPKLPALIDPQTPLPNSTDNFVPTTPVIEPGIDGTPLFTFGWVEGTPERLIESGLGPSPFRIPPTPRRDLLAHSLASSSFSRKESSSSSSSSLLNKAIERSPALKNILRSQRKASIKAKTLEPSKTPLVRKK